MHICGRYSNWPSLVDYADRLLAFLFLVGLSVAKEKVMRLEKIAYLDRSQPQYKPGDCMISEGYHWRVVEIVSDFGRTVRIAPCGWRYHAALTLSKLRATGRLLIRIASVWGLAECDYTTIPHAGQLRPLRWLAQLR